jgi:hypothetical protein
VYDRCIIRSREQASTGTGTGVLAGLPFEGVLRFGFPWPGFTPCTWLTTLRGDDLIERAAALSSAKLSEIKDSLRQRTQVDGEGTEAHAPR